MKYTQKEILKSIETLTNKLELLKLERTDLTKNINSVKKQIEDWIAFDESQTKLF